MVYHIHEVILMDENFIRDRITQLRLRKGVSEYQMSYDLGHSRGYGADKPVVISAHVHISKKSKKKEPAKTGSKRSLIKLFQLNQILSKKYIRTFS